MERFVRASELGATPPAAVVALAEAHGINMTRSLEEVL